MAQNAIHFGLVLHCLPCITGKVLFSLVRNTDKYVISFKTTRCEKAVIFSQAFTTVAHVPIWTPKTMKGPCGGGTFLVERCL